MFARSLVLSVPGKLEKNAHGHSITLSVTDMPKNNRSRALNSSFSAHQIQKQSPTVTKNNKKAVSPKKNLTAFYHYTSNRIRFPEGSAVINAPFSSVTATPISFN